MKREIAKRWLVFCAALFICALGIALVTESRLGTSPISSLPYVLSALGALSFGAWTFVLNLVFFAAQRFLLRRDFTARHWLQVPTVLVFGLCIDLSMRAVAPLATDLYPLRLAMCIGGSALIGLGISLQVACNATIVPGDGLVMVIAYKLRKNLGNIKVLLDVGLVAAAALLAWMGLGRLEGLREGTLISALLVGAFARGFSRLTRHLEGFFTA